MSALSPPPAVFHTEEEEKMMGERKRERKRADAEKERERETDLPRLVFWFFVLFWEIYAVVLFKLYIFNQVTHFPRGVVLVPWVE